MFTLGRPITVLGFCLLLAGASACTGPRASAATTGGTVASASLGGPSTQSKLADLPPRMIATPIVVTASSGRRTSTSPASGASSQPSGVTSLRLPNDGRPDPKNLMMVDSTDGEGLWLRREPAGEPLRTWPDFSPMLVVGEDVVVDERVWKQVRTLDGQVGWAAAEYLIPADEQTIAAVLPGMSLPNTPVPLAPGVQARVAVAEPTATTAPVVAVVQPTATTPPRRPAAYVGQPAPAPTTANAQPAAAATVAATATAQPTATVAPTATPIRAPAGATTVDVDDSTLAVLSTDRGMPQKIGNRPRAGMELAAVQVKIMNKGDRPLAVYRGAFRLSLSDRSRVEPLAGGESPLPYSTSLAPGSTLEGWLTFEVPTGTRTDSLIWSPERDVSYAVGI